MIGLGLDVVGAGDGTYAVVELLRSRTGVGRVARRHGVWISIPLDDKVHA